MDGQGTLEKTLKRFEAEELASHTLQRQKTQVDAPCSLVMMTARLNKKKAMGKARGTHAPRGRHLCHSGP